jgi:uncharacterized protein YutE (UPF0331/DUF86 family)
MGSINKEKVISLIAEVQKAKGQLEAYALAPAESVLASTEKMNSLKYLFIVAIEACIDICQHMSAKMFQETPESYSSCFDVLVSKKVIPDVLGSRMAELARFRSILVHLYWKVDDRRVIENLSSLGALEEYSRYIADYVKIR